MRLEINSSNRIGISQEILTAFAQQHWDLKAVEVSANYTFVHIEGNDVAIAKVHACLATVEGILTCKPIALLPAEQRENHLQALLDRIPDAIVDINKTGIILGINQAAYQLLQTDKNVPLEHIEGQSIETFIDQNLASLILDKPSSTTIIFQGKTFLADINPLIIKGHINGAVITLRTMNKVGRQMALMQMPQQQGFESIIGQSAHIKLLIEQAKRYAELELPVLIHGETGTGKELIARALHQVSPRSKAPFLAINCAALPENLLESELFGYASGAFTGAKKGGKPGLFELAEGGSVFLDEIAEMSIYLQAKLLRFLQDFCYRRVGGTTELKANVRIISASHQNLTDLIEKQQFREDLFYRLNVLNLALTPLRSRREDIVLLVAYFLENAAKQVSQQTPKLNDQALTILQDYAWPGNIRQLQNILFRVVALNDKAIIEARDIQSALAQFKVSDPGQLSHENTQENAKENAKENAQEVVQEVVQEKVQLKAQHHNEFEDKSINSTVIDWASAQAEFEERLLRQLYPLFPSTRKLAQRLHVSHNKIAMKLRALGLIDKSRGLTIEATSQNEMNKEIDGEK